MKRCMLVWQIQTIAGEHYSPIMYAINIRKAKQFIKELNYSFKNNNMDWECVLDESGCTLNEIFSSQYQLTIFAPEAKTRLWLYKKDLQKMKGNSYYLDYMEYNNVQLKKLIKFIGKFS